MIRSLHSLVTVLHFSLYMKKAISSLDRSSRSEVFCEKVAPKNFAKFTTCRQFCKKKKLPCVQTCWKQLYCWICFLVTTEYQKVRVANFGGLEGLLLTSQMLMKVKKIQTQLYHSIEDKKPCKNHLKTITWKFRVFKI